MNFPAEFLWQPLFEASAQTIVGAIGGYSVGKLIEKFSEKNTFDGPMDLWKRGIRGRTINRDDAIVIDGLISPYSQLFPGDPLQNGRRWNKLYSFAGSMTSEEYQAMDFFAGGDAALRIGSINGETLVGIYARFGYIGDGLIGIVPTAYLRKNIPDFFHPNFAGMRAKIFGKLAICPAQHGFIAQDIANRAGIPFDVSHYKNLFYLNIHRIRVARKEKDKSFSLIGSPWTATENKNEQYLVQYGYLDDNHELEACIENLRSSRSWEKARVFFDDFSNLSEEIKFKNQFILS